MQTNGGNPTDPRAFARLQREAQREVLSVLTRSHEKEIDAIRQRYGKQGRALLEQAQKDAALDLERHLDHGRKWYDRIRTFLETPAGRERLPGLLPPFDLTVEPPGRFLPEIDISVTTCFLQAFTDSRALS